MIQILKWKKTGPHFQHHNFFHFNKCKSEAQMKKTKTFSVVYRESKVKDQMCQKWFVNVKFFWLFHDE